MPNILDFNPITGNFDLVPEPISQIVTVAKSGGMFTHPQAATDAITDASVNKKYVVQIYPGVYVGPLVVKPYISYVGVSTGGGDVVLTASTTVVSGTTQSDSLTTFSRIAVVLTPTTDNQSCFNITGALGCFDVFCQTQATTNVTANFYTTSSSTILALSQCRNQLFNTYVGLTKNIDFINFSGTGQFFCNGTSNEANINAASGTHCVFKLGNTAEVLVQNGGVVYTNIGATFSGEVRGSCISTTTTKLRVIEGADWRFTGGGAGTCSAFYLNSGGNSAQVFIAGMVASIDGFANEYVANTAITDTQKIWLNSINKDVGITGIGLAIVTPYAEAKTGFVSWSQDPAITTFFTYTAATRTFKVDKRGAGIVKGAPVTWNKDQSVVLTNKKTNYVYMNSKGIIGVTDAPTEALFEDDIVLFEVWANGLNFLVSKENHPYKFTTSISSAWHNLFGSLLEENTTVLSSVNTRQVAITGGNVISDHGLTSTVAAQTGGAVWNICYTEAAGTLNLYGTSTANLPEYYNNAGTPTLLTAGQNRWVVYRLGVIKDNLTGTAQYIALMDNAQQTSSGNATTRINSNLVQAFPSELSALEICQLGFAVVRKTSAGAIDTSNVPPTTLLQVFGAAFIGGGVLTDAGLIPVNTTNFSGELSSADTTVQACLDRLDSYDSVLAWATGETFRVGNKVRSISYGLEGVWVCVIAHTSGTFDVDVNSSNWNLLSSPRGTRQYQGQPSPNFFAPEDVVAYSGGAWIKAKADVEATAEVIGICVWAGSSVFGIVTQGYAVLFGATDAETTYFLSDTTAGLYTKTPPSVVGRIIKPLFTTNGALEAQLNIMRGDPVGGGPTSTAIGLANGTATTICTINVPAGSGGKIEGVINIDGTADTTLTFSVEFTRKSNGTTYEITPDFGAGALLSGLSISNTGAAIQVTLPSVAGFVSATATYNYASIYQGATLPLAISARSVLGDTSGSAVPAGAIGETLLSRKTSATRVTFSNGNSFNLTSLALTPGRWLLSGDVLCDPSSNASETVTTLIAAISPTSASLGNYLSTASFYADGGVNPWTVLSPSLSLASLVVDVSVNTTYYFVVNSQWSAYTTAGVIGFFQAVRIA